MSTKLTPRELDNLSRSLKQNIRPWKQTGHRPGTVFTRENWAGTIVASVDGWLACHGLRDSPQDVHAPTVVGWAVRVPSPDNPRRFDTDHGLVMVRRFSSVDDAVEAAKMAADNFLRTVSSVVIHGDSDEDAEGSARREGGK